MIKRILAVLCLSLASGAMAANVPLKSASVLVVEDGTGKVLLEKNASDVVPIASLTKLMTAMVVLDAKQSLDDTITIDNDDVDTLKHSASHVPVGATMTRGEALQLALMSSDNRAAHALGRTYPGGMDAFRRAVSAKARTLGMTQTVIAEPTGLSPENKSTAVDLAKMADAAANYPDIRRITTDTREVLTMKGRKREYHNTNRLVGAKGWDIGLSKTGYTEEAGRCLIMRVKAAGRYATVVLLNAKANSARMADALNIRRLLAGNEAPVAAKAKANPPKARKRALAANKTKARNA
ncbi:serine hydrolase [Massilia sp. TS11]|uniref:serine hydrolase n=1 Tax=Massilia sp. TS11 TaxID=2908003 RepID=UPI001EDAF4E6|nr:serine hydrolase [Massilia sp. TS11]MCG2584018.1 serine hydrolase [Massilia sp. TS11]